MFTYLKISAGEFRSRVLKSPRNGLKTRPMLSRVKESLFDILAPKLKGANCLDLFSGSGSIGLEALSRGAQRITFIEKDRGNVDVIRHNIELLGVGEKSIVQNQDVLTALARIQGPFDLIFCDPPFECVYIPKILDKISQKRLLAQGGILMVQRPRRVEAEKSDNLEMFRSHEVGDSQLVFYRNAFG